MTEYTEKECMQETIRLQDAEINRLSIELKMALADIEGHVAQKDELRAQVEALTPNAERYLWLSKRLDMRQEFGFWWILETETLGEGEFQSLDDAVDAALREGD
jgi:hypothetical protein